MKDVILARFSVGQEAPTWGVVADGRVQVLPGAESGVPEGAAAADGPENELVARVRELAGDEASAAAVGAEDGSAGSYSLDEVRLEPPLVPGAVVLAVGRNYGDHAAEADLRIPKYPKLFAKLPRTAVGHEADVHLHRPQGKVDFEVELGVVIGRDAWRVPESEAMAYVGGYTIANDISDRDIQFQDEQLFLGKNFDTFCPLGPWIVTADEMPGAHDDIAVELSLNGVVMQQGSTAELIFSIPRLVAFASSVMRLRPGDVILTGTPAGVGCFREPPVYLRDGDRLEASVGGIGTLRNVVRDRT